MDREILEQWAKEALAQEPYPDPRFPPSPYYRFLRILAQNLQPRLSVELGVCGGGGSFHLAIGWPEGKVVGVDISGYDYPENRNFIASHCPNFEFWLGDSIHSARAIYEDFGEVDILFLDSIHTYEHSMAELAAYRPYLSDRAVVCFDDLFRVEMKGLWESLPEPKVRLDTLHDGAECGGGFGVLWK
jgi:cephalosporin hydroxylase